MLFHVSGCKGGVGKSLTSVAIIDSLARSGEKVALIESDDSANDVGKIYSSEIPCFFLTNLRSEDELNSMATFLAETKDRIFVLNAGAREVSLKRDESFNFYLADVIKKSCQNVETLWLLTSESEIDGLVSLSRFLDLVPWRVHILHNEIRGGDLRNIKGSKVQREIESRGGRLVRVPPCAKYVAHQISNARKSPDWIAQNGPTFLHKAAVAHWRKQVDKMFFAVVKA